MATKATIKDLGDNTEEANEAPLAGAGTLNDAVKKLLKKGRERGTITLDELNAVLPPERISSEFIEDVMAQLNDMGITVVEGEDGDGEAAPAEGTTVTSEAEDYGRTDDPVRLYLREMGAVELLSREGEIAIAKRIEAGREMMIGGICESPLTIQAIVDWNEALKEGRLLLRDIIDLDATQGGPDNAGESATPAADAGSGDAATDAAVKTEGAPAEGETTEGGEGAEDNSSFEDEDNISLAAIEEKLKPQVIETFDRIAATYTKLNKLQHARLDAVEKGETPSKQSETKIAGYQHDLVELVRTVRFNNARLEQLVQQLYTLNRRLMGLEGRLLRLGVDAGLGREEFLERYYGHELDPNWFAHVLLPPPPPAPVVVENPAERLIAQRERAHAAEAVAAAKQAEKDAKLKVIADAKAEKAAIKQAERDRKAAAAQAIKDAAKAAAQKLKDQAAAAKAKEAEKAAALKAKEAARVQAQKAKDQAAKDKARAAAQKLKDQAAAARAKEAAKKQAERDKLAAQKAKAAAQKAKAKPAPKKPVPKAVAKKPAKPAPKKTVKPAPKKAAVKKPAPKPAAKKSAAKKKR